MPKGKRHSAHFKFKVALDAARGVKTFNELAGEYELHPSQISEWKSRLLKEGASVFSPRLAADDRSPAPAGLGGQSQARAAPDAKGGIAGDLSQASDEHRSQRTQGVSVLTAQPGNHEAEPGVECRHHLHPDATRVYVPRSGYGLVQPLCSELAALEHLVRAGSSVGKRLARVLRALQL
jgi:transposase